MRYPLVNEYGGFAIKHLMHVWRSVASAIVAMLVLTSESTLAMNIEELWDFHNPELSEQRFKNALLEATTDQKLILQTQIARTYSLRKEYNTARDILAKIDQSTPMAAETRIRYRIELGRTYASASHPPSSLSADDLSKARSLYLEAYEIAKAAGMHGLAIDALHMMAFVDHEPKDQLAWARKALELANSSDQPQAKKWQASLTNNAGYALHRMGRFEEALVEFRKALELRQQGSNAWATHIAHWMIAWTLRALGRPDEALDIQLGLERDRDALGKPDVSVYEELEILYRNRGDDARADHYAVAG